MKIQRRRPVATPKCPETAFSSGTPTFRFSERKFVRRVDVISDYQLVEDWNHISNIWCRYAGLCSPGSDPQCIIHLQYVKLRVWCLIATWNVSGAGPRVRAIVGKWVPRLFRVPPPRASSVGHWKTLQSVGYMTTSRGPSVPVPGALYLYLGTSLASVAEGS